MAALRYFGEVFQREGPDLQATISKNKVIMKGQKLSEFEAKKILSIAGLPITLETLVQTSEEAIHFWRKIEKPVALKISSSNLQHKTEMGGVLLNLNDEHGIREAFNKLSEIAKEISEESAIESILICDMIDNGVETVLGVVKDPVFGPTVMFGLGGIFIEILKDV